MKPWRSPFVDRGPYADRSPESFHVYWDWRTTHGGRAKLAYLAGIEHYKELSGIQYAQLSEKSKHHLRKAYVRMMMGR